MIILKIAEALNRKDERGFTLIELLIVIAILAILAAIAIPLITSRVQDARDAADTANVRMLQGAVDLYVIDNPGTALTTGVASATDSWVDTLVEAGYLPEKTESPNPGKDYNLTEALIGEVPTGDDNRPFNYKVELVDKPS
ncbi:MAG TPA: prepilin-type N-terminal cleavage/methylation domain-containing protein [Firmicutes bacterium]|nr:prepilin-type N-terminal cleavage/methylation domain-containing protein [Bacillota bacterium]